MSAKLTLDTETALETATLEQLWDELKKRCIDCVFIYDVLNEEGTQRYSQMLPSGTIAQLLGLLRFADIQLVTGITNNVE